MKNTQTLAPRWIRYGMPGIVAGFLVVLTFTFVSAQSFTNPTCNPLEDLNCNKSSPLFLDPEDNNATQVVQSPVSIGDSTTPRALELYGNTNLRGAGKLTTPSAIAGQAINVLSTGEHAIYGSSAGSLKAGVYGIASSAVAYGVAGSTGSNNTFAIFGDASTGGNAAKFVGPVVIQRSSSNQTATLSIDSTGNLNVATSTGGTGITVNGTAIGSSGIKTRYLTADVARLATRTFNKTELFGASVNYRLVSINAMYAPKTTGSTLRTYIPVPSINILGYDECSAAPTSFLGNLRIQNPNTTETNGITLRVVVMYEEVDVTSACGGESTPPDIVWSTQPTSGAAGTMMTVYVNASDNIGVTKVEFYDNGVLSGTDSSASAAPNTHSFVWTRTSGSHAYYALAYDAAGNTKQTNTVNVTNTDACNDTCNISTQFCCDLEAPPVCKLNGATCGGGGGPLEL